MNINHYNQQIAISCINVQLSVFGTTDIVKVRRWNESEGGVDGYYDYIDKPLNKNLIGVKFRAEIASKESLNIGGAYSDGTNVFIAIGERVIVNKDLYVATFSIPESLIMIQSKI